MGHVQQDRMGFESNVEKKCFKAPPKEERFIYNMILSQIKNSENKAEIQRSAQHVQKDQWTIWDGVIQRNVAYSAPLKLVLGTLIPIAEHQRESFDQGII